MCKKEKKLRFKKKKEQKIIKKLTKMEKTCNIKTICIFELVENYMKLYAQKAMYCKLKKKKHEI